VVTRDLNRAVVHFVVVVENKLFLPPSPHGMPQTWKDREGELSETSEQGAKPRRNTRNTKTEHSTMTPYTGDHELVIFATTIPSLSILVSAQQEEAASTEQKRVYTDLSSAKPALLSVSSYRFLLTGTRRARAFFFVAHRLPPSSIFSLGNGPARYHYHHHQTGAVVR
jgi:hypothetical protein